MQFNLRFVSAAASLLLLGAPSGSAQHVHREHWGTEPNGRFGTSVCALSDADGDAVIDYAIAEESPGAVAAFSGGPGTLLWRIVVPQPRTMSPAGDLNGDGAGDLWLAISDVVELHSGRDGTLLRRIAPGQAPRALGFPDVNGDVLPDVAFATVISSDPSTTQFRVEMRSGPTLQVLWTITIGIRSGFSFPLANAGDADGNGIDDVAIADPGRGELRILSGATGGLIRSFVGTQFSFGVAICGLGDLDGDQRAEVAVGAQQDPHPVTGVLCGAVWIYSPARDVVLRTAYPPSIANLRFGSNLTTVGDLDEDGLLDFAAGTPAESNNDGGVRVHSSGSGRELMTLRGSSAELFGLSIARVGDVDGDGRTEWLIAARDAVRSLPLQGRVLVLSGRYIASAEPLGQGCSTAAMPEPRLYGTTRPIIGSNFELWNGAAAPAVVLMGGVAALPWRVGLTACRFYVELTTAAVIGSLPANSAWTFAIPLDTSLIGLSLFFQGVVEDPLGSTYGFVLSNGLLVRFGW